MQQYIVDAFTDKIFQGNPAAVCLPGAWPPDEVLQAIAAENNLSETAFAVGADGHYHLRWFTPTQEINLCGHATLATAWVLAQIREPSREQFRFHTLAGDLPATVREGLVTLDFPRATPTPIPVTPLMTAALGAEPTEAWLDRDLLLVLDAPDAVRNLQVDLAKVAQLPGLCIAVTAPAEPDLPYQCVSRVFAPEVNIPEDPVTGSAHCLIAPYWSGRLGRTQLTACQCSPRGGILHCVVTATRVFLSGQAVLYAVGRIFPQGCASWRGPEMVEVRLEPEGKDVQLKRPKTVSQLLQSLGLAEETALVVRDGMLLTPDERVMPGQRLLVRKAGSRG